MVIKCHSDGFVTWGGSFWQLCESNGIEDESEKLKDEGDNEKKLNFKMRTELSPTHSVTCSFSRVCSSSTPENRGPLHSNAPLCLKSQLKLFH